MERYSNPRAVTSASKAWAKSVTVAGLQSGRMMGNGGVASLAVWTSKPAASNAGLCCGDEVIGSLEGGLIHGPAGVCEVGDGSNFHG